MLHASRRQLDDWLGFRTGDFKLEIIREASFRRYSNDVELRGVGLDDSANLEDHQIDRRTERCLGTPNLNGDFQSRYARCGKNPQGVLQQEG